MDIKSKTNKGVLNNLKSLILSVTTCYVMAWAAIVTVVIQMPSYMLLVLLPQKLSIKHITIRIYWLISRLLIEFGFITKHFYMSITGNRYNLIATGDDISGERNTLLVSNHVGSSDWIFNCHIFTMLNAMGNVRFMMKKEIIYTPIGWPCLFHGMIFLDRNNREKDIKTINDSISNLNKYGQDIWLLLYPEGTFVTPNNPSILVKSKGYSELNNMKICNNVLTPRTTGFEYCIDAKNNFNSVVDITLAFEKPYTVKLCEQFVPTTVQLFGAYEPLNVHVHIRKYDIEDIKSPKKFLNKIWEEKEDLLEQFEENQKFPGEKLNYTYNWKHYIIFTLGVLVHSLLWYCVYYISSTLFLKCISFVLFVVIIMMSYEQHQLKVKQSSNS
jgi:1-acyl-sn-glycerol-3-phosphate acyltransferase